jgi:menaquinol-cytochrome c reductase iron-sulfur subunit
MKKRRFLRLFIAAAGTLISGIVGIPAGIVALSPSRRRDGKAEIWQPVGPIEDFSIGLMTRANVTIPRADWAQSLREKGVFVLRKGGGDIVVFSRNCTDLSCPITWDPGSEWFFCPCHGGIFSKEGEPKAGPPRDPLYRYATRVREGVLEIDLNSIPPMA